VASRVGGELDGEWTTGQTTYATAGDGVPGGDLNFRFNYLPGDITRNRQTNLADVNLVRNLGTAVPGANNYWFDFTANNQVNLADVNAIRNLGTMSLSGSSEPSNPPTPPALDLAFPLLSSAAEPTATVADDDVPLAAPDILIQVLQYAKIEPSAQPPVLAAITEKSRPFDAAMAQWQSPDRIVQSPGAETAASRKPAYPPHTAVHPIPLDQLFHELGRENGEPPDRALSAARWAPSIF
jgi:hypothetical protein